MDFMRIFDSSGLAINAGPVIGGLYIKLYAKYKQHINIPNIKLPKEKQIVLIFAWYRRLANHCRDLYTTKYKAFADKKNQQHYKVLEISI